MQAATPASSSLSSLQGLEVPPQGLRTEPVISRWMAATSKGPALVTDLSKLDWLEQCRAILSLAEEALPVFQPWGEVCWMGVGQGWPRLGWPAGWLARLMAGCLAIWLAGKLAGLWYG